MRRCWGFVLKTLVGTLLCMGAVSSVLVVGWVQRVMQREAIKRWHNIENSPDQLAEFLNEVHSNGIHQHWPN